MESSDRTSKWLAKQISHLGRFSAYPDDLACYYKAPYFLAITGQEVLAARLCNYIKSTFFKTNDFSNQNIKTDNPALQKFWGYVIAWIGIGSQKLGFFDISYPAYQYLRRFYSQDHGAFGTHGPWGEKDDTIDMLTTAHFGRLSLFMGEKERSLRAGEFLSWMIEHQVDLANQMLLAVNNNREFIKQFPQDQAFFYTVKKCDPQQAYFMIGYPCAYLAELYHITGNVNFLEAAKKYANFALQCNDNIKAFPYSHKVAWAMSLMYRYTKENKYLALCESISHYLMSIQSVDGVWLEQDGPVNSIDQSVENAIWLREIAGNVVL
jgi:hypothetical protein